MRTWSGSVVTPRKSARSAARDLLEMTDRPTAIFAANDVSAIQTMNVVARKWV